jgi:hypothetical protein
MKLLHLLLASVIVFLFMGVSNTAMAQITVGTGTASTTANPIYSCFGYSYTEQIYLQSEIGSSGNITSVSFYINTLPSNGATSSLDWTVYLGHTTQADYSSTTNWVGASNMTQVYTGVVTYPASGNWMTITLTTPFAYNNTDNLVVGAYENTPGYDCSIGFAQTPTAVNQSIYYRSDSNNPDPLAPPTASLITLNRPNIQFGGISQACPAPTALLASNITTTSATLGWTAGGTETAWDVEYGTAGFTQGSGTTVSATVNTYALSTLSVNNAYDYYVRAVCSAGDLSLWAGPFTFSTPCVASTVPYFEGFESGYTDNAAVAGCLSQESITNNGVWTANNTQVSYNRAPYAGAWNAFLQFGNDDWLFIPIDLTGGTSYSFGAFARQDGSSPINSHVTVSYGTANNAAAMTNAIVPTTGIVDGAYQQLTGVFTPATTGTYYIGIKGYMDGVPWYISLDDISITAPNCPPPSALTANLTTTSADLGWTENGSATSWEVEYGIAGFTQGTGTAAVVAANPYAISGLTADTDYQFYVRAICAPGDTSPWAAGSLFTGYCTPAPSSVDGNGITNVTMGSINNTTGAETGNYGNYSAMVANATPGGTLPIDITLGTTFTYDMWAWVDWNNDLDFTDAGEEFFLGTSAAANTTTFTTSIAIPATASGNYRIRIGGADSGLGVASPSFPCYTGAWGTFEDYTLNAGTLSTPSLMPLALLTPANNTTLDVAGPAQNTVDITWESAGIGSATYEWRAALTTGSLNNPIVALPSNNMGMNTMLTLDIQTIDGLLASLGVGIGDTATIQWTAVAFAGGDSLFATAPFTLNLIRYGVSSPLFVNAPQNTATSTQVRAPNGLVSHTYLRAATVVLPTEFTTAGVTANTTIRNFGFNTSVPVPAGSVTGIFKLYLENTTSSTYGKGTAWSGITPGMTLVFDDTVTINGGVSAWDVVLNTLFNYNGDAVYVAYDWETIGTPLASPISYFASTALASGLVSGSSATIPPATLAGSSFRPEFSWGIDRNADDLEVVALYAMGKNPLGYSQAEQVQAIVRNNGYLPADKAVTLNITGTNPYTTTENVTLTPGQETVVSFMAYNPTTAGNNAMTVSVPADQVAGNDAQTWVQETTTNTFSYADSVLTGLGGVGYNTGDGLLLNRYYVNGAASINQVRIRISDDAAAVGNTVYAVLMDTSGTVVSQSANYVITAGDLETWVTFNLQTSVNVSDVDVLVGLAQTANAVTGYFPIAYQDESLTRPNAYFGSDLNGANLGAVNGFRLMIEAVVGPACAVTSSSVITNASCFGDASGSIAITAAGGTAPYTYAWSDGQTTDIATGLVAAAYSVTITDANGCSLVSGGSIGQPLAVATSSVITNASCFGDVNGSIAITATGGTAPYTYIWNDGQTMATATGLIAAAYDVTVTDANGCSLVSGGAIGQPLAITLTATSVSDTSSAGIGTASVTAGGGTAPYTYAWSDGQTTDIATGLMMGTYTVTVTDVNGCTETETVTVDDFVSTTRLEYITNVSIYPNPTNGNTVIDLELSQNADVAVSIYTVTGVLVQDFGKENTSKATHIVDVTAYPAGMYLVRFVVDNQIVTKKLLVTK